MPDHPDPIPARALLIDLDDTLYDEGDYVRSGFRVVAARLALLFPGTSEARIYQSMLTELNANGRGKVFDRALESIGQSPELKLVAGRGRYSQGLAAQVPPRRRHRWNRSDAASQGPGPGD